MNIRGWPMDRIMQLPDNCFGRKFVLGTGGIGNKTAAMYRVSRCALPELAVLWQIVAVGDILPEARGRLELRLGDQLPATRAEFAAMEPLLSCVECVTTNVSRLLVQRGAPIIIDLRMPVRTGGRRLITEHGSADLTIQVETAIYTVWSSMPTEVPDWLCSGRV